MNRSASLMLVALMIASAFIIPSYVEASILSFDYTTTADFDSGTKTSTATITNSYEGATDALRISSPPRARDANQKGVWLMSEGSGATTADSSGNGNTGTLSNPASMWTASGKFGNGLTFNGTSDYVDAGAGASLNVGTGNFTISSWVNTQSTLTDSLGDIISKFDQTNKKGINFGFLSQSSFSSQSNYRNLYFGIDNNKPDSAWVQKAPKLNSETYIYSLAVYNGKLYGGTYPNGTLFEWNGVNAWVQKAPKLNSESRIYSLAVYNGKLYGGTYPNGNLFEWNGVNAWVQKAPKLNSETYIFSLAVYNGKLYGGTAPNGNLFEWNGVNAWVQKAPLLNSETYIYSLAVYNGKLYGGTSPNGNLFEWNGVNAWVQKAPLLNSEIYILSLAVYNGKLYGGTYPNGNLFEWNGVNAWVQKAPLLNSESRIYSLAVYNGKLYGGTYPNGNLFEWNGVNAWVRKAPKLNSETYIYSLAVYNGKLYGGTSPNGNLFEWKTGVSVSYDYDWSSGWMHALGVKYAIDASTSAMKLYVNGALVSTSSSFTTSDYDLTTAQHLLIGFGEQDYFNGIIDEVQLYNRALDASEVSTLYNNGLQYKTSGNWKSPSISIPANNQLTSITETLSSGDASNYIDKVEIRNAGTNALITTANADKSATATLVSADFDNGLSGTQGISIKVQVYFIGAGTTSISLDELSGQYDINALITFYINPTSGGTITFDGVTYTHGQTVNKMAGSYSITANPATNYAFDSWTTTGGISIVGSTATITNNGSITANFHQLHYRIYLNDTPTDKGTVTFNSTLYTNGQYEDVYVGGYTVTANPVTNWAFDSWSTTGGVSVAGGIATVTGAGSITANYYQLHYSITLNDDPSNKGTVTFNGTVYSHGDHENVYVGDYSVSANPVANWAFSSWSTTGGVSIVGSTATVTGAGTITAHYYQLHYTITLNDLPIAGGNITFNGTLYHNGEHEDVYVGDYSVVANPSTNYVFDSWSCTGGVSIIGNTATVTGIGTITAHYHQLHYWIYLNDTPSDKGNITFNGTLYNNGGHEDVYYGDYTITANPVTNWAFQSWTTTGNVSIVGGATAHVTGNGTITANYYQLHYTIYLNDTPSAGGNISFNGTIYIDGQFESAYAGTYAVSPDTATHWAFDSWSVTGGVSIIGVNAIVTGNGSITAHYHQLHYNVYLNDTPSIGGSITFNATLYTDGQYESVYVGDYAIVANPNAHYAFTSWSASGNVTITGGGTTAHVTGAGEILAHFTQLHYNVTLNDTPLAGGTTTFNGTLYSNGGIENVYAGDYPLVANPSVHWVFDNFTANGSITIVGGNTAHVDGDGVILAHFHEAHYNVSFIIAPAFAGSITFNGTVYIDGQMESVYAGAYAVVPNPIPYYAFTSWSTSANITIIGGIATVDGNGTITTYFHHLHYNITLNDNPSTRGNISFNGTSYTNGQVASVYDGNYAVSPLPATHWEFDHWNTSGNVTILAGVATVTGNGTIIATYYQLHYNITLYDIAPSQGAILFNSTIYTNGLNATCYVGAYAITPLPSLGYTFNSWTFTGNASVLGGVASVWGNGTITAHFELSHYDVTLNDNPITGGLIVFNGTTYAHGGHASALAGTYSLAYIEAFGYHFTSWSVSANATIGVGTVTITGDCTILANFVYVSPPIYNITLDDNPTTAGSIIFDNIIYSNGQHAVVVAGTYNVSAVAMPGYAFNHFDCSGGIVMGIGHATISDNGTITAFFNPVIPPSSYTIIFHIDPVETGTIIIDGASYQDNDSNDLPVGISGIEASPISGYVFDYWTDSGGAHVHNDTVTVSGNGTVTAHFKVYEVPLDGILKHINYDEITGVMGTVATFFMLIGIAKRRKNNQQHHAPHHSEHDSG